MHWDRRRPRHVLLVAALAIGFSLIASSPSRAEVPSSQRDTALVTFHVTVPSTTPPGDPVFIVGDFQGWNPGDPAYQLTDLGGLVYEIALDLTVGATIEYKFTRGSWVTVEKGASGEEIPNR